MWFIVVSAPVLTGSWYPVCGGVARPAGVDSDRDGDQVLGPDHAGPAVSGLSSVDARAFPQREAGVTERSAGLRAHTQPPAPSSLCANVLIAL